MPVIKPGKLRIGGAARPEERKEQPLIKTREVWDDYVSPKTKKREYEKGAGNRMVPKSVPGKEPRR
ncbi:MAG TPA: hypothetical protein PLP17_02200, partial [Oligoflexia bacterium]|nr:hypothetical protein [Oligoflexia bacterium]